MEILYYPYLVPRLIDRRLCRDMAEITPGMFLGDCPEIHTSAFQNSVVPTTTYDPVLRCHTEVASQQHHGSIFGKNARRHPETEGHDFYVEEAEE